MLKQEKRTKPSSSEKRLLRELDAAKTGFDAMEISLRSKPSDVIAVYERRLVPLRRELLLELANASDRVGVEKFERRVKSVFRKEPDGIIQKLRDSLQQIWSPSTPLRQKQRIVDAWFISGFRDLERPGLKIFLEMERLVLDQSNLRLQLCLGIMENWRKFRVCKNPLCPNRYFLADRSTRSVCDRTACKSYAQRKYALAWWNRVGKQRRENKQGKRGK